MDAMHAHQLSAHSVTRHRSELRYFHRCLVKPHNYPWRWHCCPTCFTSGGTYW